MPRVDFSNVGDVADFSPIPDGEYLVRLVDIETDATRSGDEMWKLRLQVEGGEHDGRLLFDNLVFSAKAMSRVKLICASFGLDVSGTIDVEPELLLDKRAMVSTYQEEYEDDRGQQEKQRHVPGMDVHDKVGQSLAQRVIFDIKLGKGVKNASRVKGKEQ